MKKNNTPIKRGSAGKDKDNPIPPPSLSNPIDKGVTNAIKNNTLSKEKAYNIKTPNTKGSANIRYMLFSTTKYRDRAINNAAIR